MRAQSAFADGTVPAMPESDEGRRHVREIRRQHEVNKLTEFEHGCACARDGFARLGRLRDLYAFGVIGNMAFPILSAPSTVRRHRLLADIQTANPNCRKVIEMLNTR